MQDEFVVFSAAVQEAVWLKIFLNHLSFYENETNSVLVHSDNQATISYTKNLKYNSKAKHIDTKKNFARDMMVKNKFTCITYLHTKW
jgi:hypothetical protein